MHGTVSGNAADRREMLVRNNLGGILGASVAEEGFPRGEGLGDSGFRTEDAGHLYEGSSSIPPALPAMESEAKAGRPQ